LPVRYRLAAGLTVRNITHGGRLLDDRRVHLLRGKHGLVEAIFLDGFDSFDEAVRPGLESGDLLLPVARTGAGRSTTARSTW
jgi:hypothetical protein